jgi:hypothetical protein
VRVPTWCPFRLQFYCNGHNWLARQLDRRHIRYTRLDNATAIEDGAAAQQLSDNGDASGLHRKLDEFSDRYCPILKQIEESYHWSLDEAEYATASTATTRMKWVTGTTCVSRARASATRRA